MNFNREVIPLKAISTQQLSVMASFLRYRLIHILGYVALFYETPFFQKMEFDLNFM
jgi:hypothetical protein